HRVERRVALRVAHAARLPLIAERVEAGPGKRREGRGAEGMLEGRHAAAVALHAGAPTVGDVEVEGVGDGDMLEREPRGACRWMLGEAPGAKALGLGDVSGAGALPHRLPLALDVVPAPDGGRA